MRTMRAAAALLVVLFPLLGVEGSTAQPARVLFDEEFSGPELDRTRWNVIVTGRTVNAEQQAYVDSKDVLYLEDGNLVIQPRSRPGFTTADGRKFDFISGRIDTRDRFSFTYGTAAARMKLAAGAGLWPAFWALGAGRWPDTGEIDIMENVGDPAWTSVALHGPGYSGSTPLVKRMPLDRAADATAWHVYAVNWTADAIAFRVDDREIYRVTRPMVEPLGAWAFDNPKHLIVNLALGGNFPAAVNKASVPYRGLPEATVKAIQAGEPRILVDWVRVTAR